MRIHCFRGTRPGDSRDFDLDPNATLSEVRRTLTKAGFMPDDIPSRNIGYRFVVQQTQATNLKDALVQPVAEQVVPLQGVLGDQNQLIITNEFAQVKPDLIGIGTNKWSSHRYLTVECRLNNSEPAARQQNARVQAFEPLMLKNVVTTSTDARAKGAYEHVCLCTSGSAVQFVVTSWGSAGFEYYIGADVGEPIVSSLYICFGNAQNRYGTATIGRWENSPKLIEIVGTSQMQLGARTHAYQRVTFKSRRLWEYTQDGVVHSSNAQPPAEAQLEALVVPGGGIEPGGAAKGPESEVSFGNLENPKVDDWDQALGEIVVHFFVFKSHADALTTIGGFNAAPGMEEAYWPQPDTTPLPPGAIDLLNGTYRRQPVENDWHTGIIGPGSKSDGKLLWTNRAGASWSLEPDLARNVLRKEEGSPYQDQEKGREFTVIDREGKVDGFKFLDEFYVRDPATPSIDEDAITGTYIRHPVENDWHTGTIQFVPDGCGKMVWRNRAGVAWNLLPDLAQNVLRKEEGSPYQDQEKGREFKIVASRGEVEGFEFLGEFYERNPSTPVITLASITGTYVRHPVENDWHTGTIQPSSSGKLMWRNQADAAWDLNPDFAHNILRKGEGSPYQDQEKGREFKIVTSRGEVHGFEFLGEFYARDSSTPAIEEESLAGTYVRHPVENDWHTGTIQRNSSGKLMWRNQAGVVWDLNPDLGQNVLRKEEGSPYQDQAEGREFKIVAIRGGVKGFEFLGEFYARDPSTPAITVQSFAGTYRRLPVENDWHTGTIQANSDGNLTWQNQAGVAWDLNPDLAQNLLRKEEGSPYQEQPKGREFEIVVNRGAVEGFVFLDELYARDPSATPISEESLDGTYRRHPVENDWHTGTIQTRPGGQLTWQNQAGVVWNLTPDLTRYVLRKEEGSPYQDQENGREFKIVASRGGVDGFEFLGEFYKRDR